MSRHRLAERAAAALPKRLSRPRRGAAKIFAGTAVGQVLALASAPVLSRLFTPSDMGVLTIVTALAALMATIAALRLELAVPLPELERDARSLVAAGLISALLTAILGTALVAAYGDWATRAFRNPELETWLWFAPSIAAIMASYLVLNQLAVRQLRYGAVGRRNLLSSLTTVTTQLVAGAAGIRPGGLVLGLATGQIVGAFSLLLGSRSQHGGGRSAYSFRSILVVVRRFRSFPLLLAPAGLLNALGLQLPLLLFAYYYGSAAAGWFGLTQRVLALPVMLIGQAVAQVYLGELTRDVRARGHRASQLFMRTSIRLAALALIGTTALLAFGPWLFGTAFGPDWRPSGDYARALALALGAQLVASPLSQTLIVLGHQYKQLAWDGLRLVMTVAAVACPAGIGLPPLTATWLLGGALTASYAVGWGMARRAVGP